MLLFVNRIFLFFAESSHASGGFSDFYNKYLNYPGFEAWKFLNLAIFIASLVYILKKPLSEAFKKKREEIRAELIKAQEEKEAALARLVTAEAKLAELESDKKTVLEKAKQEAVSEKTRIAVQTESDINRLNEQTESEITRLAKQVKAELRRFSAEESIRLADEKLRAEMNTEKDARLVRASIDAIGVMN